MPTTVLAYAATGADQPLTLTTIQRRDVGPHDVRIEVRFAGICHSDIHTVRGDWGPVPYPLVVGHEIAGIVVETGGAVTKHAVGDRVGVGCMVDSCRACEQCAKGQEQFCQADATMTYASTDRDGSVTQGGYSQQVVVTEDFVLRIPEALGLDVAAPLLCAGVTTYSPLRHWGAGPGMRVAVVGMGGLGHLAVRLAHTLGAHVTVLSQSLAKRDDGLRLGADEYHATSDPETFARLARSFDLILSTVSAVLDIDAYLSLLAVDGTMVNVGAPAQPLPVQAFSLIGGRRSLAGSSIGSIAETQQMLDFCAESGIGAEIEVIAADQVNEAWQRVLESDVRYRFVIDTTTLAEQAG